MHSCPNMFKKFHERNSAMLRRFKNTLEIIIKRLFKYDVDNNV